jgi:polysaccharide export outer membrane protein
MLKQILCFVLLASAVSTQPVLGQKPESLLIGPGDLLHVTVFDTPELEQHVRVTDAGSIPLLMGGGVSVTNRTPAEGIFSSGPRSR